MSQSARIFRVIENLRGAESGARPEPAPFALLPERPGGDGGICFAPLVRKLVEARQERSDGAAFTFVAVRSGDGVSHVVKSVAWELAHQTDEQILVTTLQGVNTVERQDLQDFRRRFGFVLLDCPAMTASPDFLKLSKLSDGFVLVVLAGHTSRPEVEWAQRTLAGHNAKLLGLVLNQRKPALPRLFSAIL
jgi:hypothetical protein